jgi:hypothetical protein
MSFDQIPIDILAVHILPYLGLTNLLRAKVVSKLWLMATIRALKYYRMTKSDGYLASTLNDTDLTSLAGIPHKTLNGPMKASVGAILQAIKTSESIRIRIPYHILKEIRLTKPVNLKHLSISIAGFMHDNGIDTFLTHCCNLSSLEITGSSNIQLINPPRLKKLKLKKVVNSVVVEWFMSVYNQDNMLDSLCIQEAYVSQKASQCLKWAKELHYISKSYEPVDVQEILALMELKNIRTLMVDYLTDSQLETITKNNRLDKLGIFDGQLTDNSLQYFQGIRSVWIRSTLITDEGLKYLNQAECITICSRLVDFNLYGLNQGRTRPLRALELFYGANSAHIPVLISPDMKLLTLRETNIGPIAHLFSNIETINIYSYQVEDSCLSHFHNCKKITIDNASKITDAGLYHLRNVEFINLTTANLITNQGLQWLKKAISISIRHNGNITCHDCLNGVPKVNIDKI